MNYKYKYIYQQESKRKQFLIYSKSKMATCGKCIFLPPTPPVTPLEAMCALAACMRMIDSIGWWLAQKGSVILLRGLHQLPNVWPHDCTQSYYTLIIK